MRRAPTRRQQQEGQQQLRVVALRTKTMAHLLERELRRVRKEAAALYPQWTPALKGHQLRMKGILRNEWLKSASLSAKRADELLRGQAGKLDTQEELSLRIFKQAEQNAAAKVGGITDTTRERISSSIALGASEDEGPRAIAARIRDTDSGIDKRRAETIARTETHAAVMTGQHEGVVAASKDLEMPMVKIWLSSGDDRTRETHAAANGQSVKLEGMFVVGEAELSYPGDPHGPAEEVINCRCTVVYEPEAVREPTPEPAPTVAPEPVAEPVPEPTVGAPAWAARIEEEYRYAGTKAEAIADIQSFGVKTVSIQQPEESFGWRNAVGATLKGFQELAERGYPVRGLAEVRIIPRDVSLHGKKGHVPNASHVMRLREGGRISLYTEADQWMVGHKTAAPGWSSTKELKSTVIHEFGHQLYPSKAALPPKGYKAVIKREVSQYAATNAAEFLAEVFSGMMEGKTYSTKVMALYQAYGGQPLRSKR